MASPSNSLVEAGGAEGRPVQAPVFNVSVSTQGVQANQNSRDYKTGFQDGLVEGEARDAALRSALFDAGANFETQLNAMDARYKEQFLALLQRLFKAIAPSLARQATLGDVTALVDAHLVRKQGRIVVRMHPESASLLLAAPSVAADDQSIVSIEKDQSMTANAFEANWADGGISHDVDALIATINQAIADHMTQKQQGCDDD